MKTVKKGRPPRKEKRHVIWLTTSTLRLWNERRKAFGLKNKSNSEFAEVLLHGMFLKRTGRFDCPDNNNNKGAQRTLVVGGPLTKRGRVGSGTTVNKSKPEARTGIEPRATAFKPNALTT